MSHTKESIPCGFTNTTNPVGFMLKPSRVGRNKQARKQASKRHIKPKSMW
jgi:hypothetical protein